MLRWALFAFVVAIVLALLGFGGISALAMKAAIVLFVVAMSLFVLGFFGAGRGPQGRLP